MIINVHTIIMLFVAFVSVALGGYLLYATIRAILAFRGILSSETKARFERKGYLVFLVACVILFVRMLVWPWFYFMLQSFVPEIPGAMCMFGVTQILPSAVTFLQIIKPIAFFFMGGWLLCYAVDKSVPTTPLMRRILYYLLPVCVILLVDGVADITYVLRMKPLMSVSCCATFFDVPLRPSAMIPQSLFGQHFQNTLFFVYYVTNVILIILLFTSLSGKWISLSKPVRVGVLCGQMVIGIVNIPVMLYTTIEYIAPKLMQLPYHHCIYCLMGNGMVIDAPVIFGLFVLGVFSVGWMGLLKLLCRHSDATAKTEQLVLKINSVAAFCLLASLIMVTVHVILV